MVLVVVSVLAFKLAVLFVGVRPAGKNHISFKNPKRMALTSEEVNYLVYRYLQESGTCSSLSFASHDLTLSFLILSYLI